MNAVCPLHGPTTVIRTNAYGFPVYACCCDDVTYVTLPDACTRAPTQRGRDPQPEQGRIDATGMFFWEDMVEQVPFPGQGPGLEGLKDVLRGMRAAFPDMHWRIEEQLSDSDRVLTRFEWTGTHSGEFLGVPATGRPVRVWGMVVDCVQEGRIKESRIITDTHGLMVQLGVAGTPGH